MLDDFYFRGEDIAAYGAVAALGDTYAIGGKVTRSEYPMPQGGSVIIGDEDGAVYGTRTRTVTFWPADGVPDTPAWRRMLVSWLQGRRGELIFKSDPEVIHYAQFDEAGRAGAKVGPLGGIEMKMTLQPLAMSSKKNLVSAVCPAGTATEMKLLGDTALGSSLELDITVQSGALRSLTIACGTQTLIFSGMSFGTGRRIGYYAGDTIGKSAEVTVDGALDFSIVSRWGRLLAVNGRTLVVTPAGGKVDVKAQFRGRWID